jgi:hypothetical protein
MSQAQLICEDTGYTGPEVRGKCPMHKVGGRIVIDGLKVVLEKTDALSIRPCIRCCPQKPD